MRYFILAIMSLSLINAADEPQPVEVLNAFAAFEKVVVEQHKKIDPIIKKAQEDALLKLEAAKVAMMKSNDLKGALMIEEAIAKLSGGNILAAIEENIKNNANILGGNVGIVGKWTHSNGNIYTLNADGTATVGGSKGKWNKIGNKYAVTWTNGAIEILNAPINNVINAANKSGTQFTLTRVP